MRGGIRPLDATVVAVRRFETRFGGAPSHVVSVPGRVNLIGEHIDYCGLPVLPMAISRRLRLAFRASRDGAVSMVNASDDFDPVTYRLDRVDSSEAGGTIAGSWAGYCRAAAVELVATNGIATGFEGAVASDVPVAAGLSSSSALVNAVGLALARVNGIEPDPVEFAELMARAERHVGTKGGGMDQAITLCAHAGSAARIDFGPLRLRHLAVPATWRIVVADTGVVAAKGGAAQSAYNERRVQSKRAVAEVAAAVGSAPAYPELLEALSVGEALNVARGILGEEAARDPVLLRRCRHVVTEAERVERACAVLADRAGNAGRVAEADIMERFGALMDDSHESLREDYEVSCPELDSVVRIMRDAGCAGARMTGAGFGGSAIGLVASGCAGGVLEALCEEYYGPAGMASRAFVEAPDRGAAVAAAPVLRP